jgi:hypothetical protein
MRLRTLLLTSTLLLALAGVALAQDESADEATEAAAEPTAEEPAEASAEAPAEAAAEETTDEAAEEEEAEPSWISQYGRNVATAFLGGSNGLITWPADPVMLTVNPTEEMLDMPGGVVTGRVVGFFAGTLQGIYRLTMGVLDVGLCPLRFFPVFSPEPRYKLIPGWEYEG